LSRSSSSKRRAVVPDPSGTTVTGPGLSFPEILGFATLVGSVAFVFSPALDSQFTLPKLVAFYSCLVGLTLLWAGRWRRGGAMRMRPLIAIPVAGLLAWWSLTLPFAVDVRTAVWGAIGRGNGITLHVGLLAWFAGIASSRLGTGGVRKLLAVMLASALILSLYAIVQAAGLDVFTWPNVRPGSTVGHPVPLAAILALTVPVGLALTVAARSRGVLALQAIATATIVFALGTTLSRGPWIGAACGMAITVGFLLRARGDRRLRAAAVAATALIAIAATVWVARVPGTRVTQRIALIARATTDPSFMNRFEYFAAALTVIRTRPMFGAGFESFGLLFPPLRPLESQTVDEDTIPTMVHNGYLDIAVWTGLPGLVIYVGLMVAIALALLDVIRTEIHDAERQALACGILGGLVAFWIQDLSGWHEVSSSVFFWAIAGLAVSLATKNDQAASGPRRSWLVTACTVMIAGIAVLVWRETYADARLARARRVGSASGWSEAKALIDEARPTVAGHASYLDRIAVIYLNRLRASPDPEAFRGASDVLRAAATANRFDPYIRIHRVDAETLALLSGLTRTVSADAIDAAAHAVELDPNNATVHETLARFYLVSQHPAQALEEIRASRSLRPGRAGLRLLEGDILRAVGDPTAALEAYRAELRLHPSGSALWIAAQQKVTASVIEAGDYTMALREAETLTGKAPADPMNQRLLDAARALRTF
jgi:O-antigen ligase